MASAEEVARGMRGQGYNWAETVLLAVSQSLGLETGDAPRIATGFGGGIGGGGSVCGALVGAVMAVGLKHGRTSASEDRRDAYSRSQRILRRFQEEMGDTLCRELTGMDLSTPEGAQAFYQSDIPQRVCQRCIATAARLAEEQLSQ